MTEFDEDNYRECPECGLMVFFGVLCSCGGDPWFVISKIENKQVNCLAV